MRLIDDDDRVVSQKEIAFNFLQQYTICHEFDAGLLCVKVLGIISNLVADFVAKLRAQLVGHSLRETDCCHTTRLGDANEQLGWVDGITVKSGGAEHPFILLGRLVNELWYLRGLTRARLTAHDRHNVVQNVFHDFALVKHDG